MDLAGVLADFTGTVLTALGVALVGRRMVDGKYIGAVDAAAVDDDDAAAVDDDDNDDDDDDDAIKSDWIWLLSRDDADDDNGRGRLASPLATAAATEAVTLQPAVGTGRV